MELWKYCDYYVCINWGTTRKILVFLCETGALAIFSHSSLPFPSIFSQLTLSFSILPHPNSTSTKEQGLVQKWTLPNALKRIKQSSSWATLSLTLQPGYWWISISQGTWTLVSAHWVGQLSHSTLMSLGVRYMMLIMSCDNSEHPFIFSCICNVVDTE